MGLHLNLGVEGCWAGLTTQISVTKMDTTPMKEEETAETVDLSLTTDDISREHTLFLQLPPSPTSSQYSQEQAPAPDTVPPAALEMDNKEIKSSSSPPVPTAATSSTGFTGAPVASIETHSSQARAVESGPHGEAGADVNPVANSQRDMKATTSPSTPIILHEIEHSSAAGIESSSMESRHEPKAWRMRRFFSPSEQVAAEEIPDQNEPVTWPSQPRDTPASARSVLSGIFELEISSPEPARSERAVGRRTSSDDVDLQDCPQPQIDVPPEPALDAFDDAAGEQAWRRGKETNYEPNSSFAPQRSSQRRLQKVFDEVRLSSPRSLGAKASSSPTRKPDFIGITPISRSLREFEGSVDISDTDLGSEASQSAVSGRPRVWSPLLSPPAFEIPLASSKSSRPLSDRPGTQVRSLLTDSLERYGVVASELQSTESVGASAGFLAKGTSRESKVPASAGSGDVARRRDASETESQEGLSTGWGWGWRKPGRRKGWGSFLSRSELRIGYIAGRSVGVAELFEAGSKSFEQFVSEQQGEDDPNHIVRSQGCSSLLVPRCQRVTQTFAVGPGCCLYWEFKVQENEIGFALRLRSQGMGGSREEDIFEMARYPSGMRHQGKWDADEHHKAILVMVWDNSFGVIFPKTVVCKTKVLEPRAEANALSFIPPPTPIGDVLRVSPDPSSRRGADGRRRREDREGGNIQAAYTETLAVEMVGGEDPAATEASVAGGGAGESKGRGFREQRELGICDTIQPEDYPEWTWSPEA